MNTTEFVLIDLSSIAYPIWHMSQSEPDPNHTANQIAERVRSMASDHARVAICCDSGRSFRYDIDPTYKGNRPEREETLHHQIGLAVDELKADGFPVWSVRGFEADDLIASAAAQALAVPGATVLVVSADKDLLQLVGPRIRVMNAKSRDIIDVEGVGKKFGVLPSQMCDYLTLVGDKSDNIKGAKGIGEQKAAALLAKFGSLDGLYAELKAKGGASIGLPSSVSQSLREFQPLLETTRKLVTLCTDVDIPFDEILADRVPQAAEEFNVDPVADEQPVVDQPLPPIAQTPAPAAAPTSDSTAMEVHGSNELIVGEPVEWQRALEPRSMGDAQRLADNMHKSRMFSAYGSPQAVLSTIMVGRELGVTAMASLRSINNIEGKHALSAALMAGIVLRSGLALYFEPIEFDETHAVYETHRRGARNPVKLTHTFEMAKKAFPKTKADWEKSFMASGWGKNPTDMLVARCQSRLARMVYPDLLANMYTPEELREMRDAVVGTSTEQVA